MDQRPEERTVSREQQLYISIPMDIRNAVMKTAEFERRELKNQIIILLREALSHRGFSEFDEPPWKRANARQD